MSGGLLVTTPSEEFGAKVANAFGNEANGHDCYWREGLFDDATDLVVSELTQSGPSVVVLGPELESEQALDLTRAFDAKHPDIVVVLVADPSIQMLERALRAGARDVVAPDSSEPQLREAFDRALDAARRRSNVATNGESRAAARHVICVVSPKGGSGKTTLSTNLAVGLAAEAPGEVVIVDLDLQFGDVASSLRLTPDHTMADITRTPLTVDATTVKIFLTQHDSGLYVLCAPESPVEADAITPELAGEVVALLATEFRYVIIDTGSGLDEPTLAVLDKCTDIIFLTATDVPSVRATRKEVETFDRLDLTRPNRHFVINRADARVGLSLADIEATVGLRAEVSVPSSRMVPLSVNHGSPVIVSDPRSPVADAMTLLVGRFADVSNRPRAGMVDRLKNKTKNKKKKNGSDA